MHRKTKQTKGKLGSELEIIKCYIHERKMSSGWYIDFNGKPATT